MDAGCSWTTPGRSVFEMKVVATYENGEIFQHFGKTEYFKVYDVQDGKVVSSEVRSTDGKGHGELIGVLRELEANVLICGGIGGGAKDGLSMTGIKVYAGNQGNADAVVEKLLAGELSESMEANCHHHDGEEGEEHHCTCGKH